MASIVRSMWGDHYEGIGDDPWAGDISYPSPYSPDGGWGICTWGGTDELCCWGGTCHEGMDVTGWDPGCDSLNASRTTAIAFTIMPTDVADQVDLTTVIVVVEVDDIAYDPTCGDFQGWTHTTSVYSASSFTSPWAGTVSANAGGYDFSITAPGRYPANSRVCVTVYAETEDGHYVLEECCFRIEDSFCITVEVISLTKLLVTFSDQMRFSDSGVTIAANWEIIPMATGFIEDTTNTVMVKTIAPDSARNPQFVIVNATEMVWDQRYQVRCSGLVDIHNRTVDDKANFMMRMTKVDHVLQGLPSTWDVRETSNFFWVLGSIARQIEKAGGLKRDVVI